MRFISADDLDRLFDPASLRDALEDVFRQEVVVPPRHHHAPGNEGSTHHLLMPAWTSGVPGEGQFLGTKIVNIFRGNAAKSLPAVFGAYVLQSGETGEPLAVLDGTRLTLWRTAATSALASRFLSRPDSRRLTMIGAGALAPFLIAAHAAVRPIRQVTIWNRTEGTAETLARHLGRDGLAVVVARDLETAVGDADIVSCATLTEQPLVQGRWLRAGQHIDLVGAFTMTMQEADDEALRRCRVFVDTADAKTEGGDVAVGLASGVITEADVEASLADLCRGFSPGRTSADDLTLFKSTGSALEDLAAAVLAYRRSGSGPGRGAAGQPASY